MIEYKGYIIEYNFYGMCEYSVQIGGDDVIFKTEAGAKDYIDNLVD